MPDVTLEFTIVHLTTYETFGIKYGIFWVGVEGILGGISNTRTAVSRGRKQMNRCLQSFVLSEADPRRSYSVTLVIGNDFHPTTSLDAVQLVRKDIPVITRSN